MKVLNTIILWQDAGPCCEQTHAAFEVGLSLDHSQGVYSGWSDVVISSQLRLCHTCIIDVMISSLNKVIVLQKKAIRIICNVNRRAPTDSLFRDLKIIPFLDVNIYMISRFMFRYVNGRVPSLFCGYITSNTSIHKYETRQARHFHLPQVRSDLGKNNIRYRGAQIWNYLLDLGINSETSESIFSKNMKYYLKNNMLTSLRTLR